MSRMEDFMAAWGSAGMGLKLLYLTAAASAAAPVPVNFTQLTLHNDFLYSKSDFILSDQNSFYFPLTKCRQMNEKISRWNYPQIQTPEFLNMTDDFAATMRGFEVIDGATKMQYLASMGEALTSKSELLANVSSWAEFFTGSLSKSQIEALPAAWQYLATEQIFTGLGGSDLADISNARPTSLGLVLKLSALLRSMPDQAKIDFINNLDGLDQLSTTQLLYTIAYRWLPAFSNLTLSNLLELPADAVMAMNAAQLDLIINRLKNVKVWSLADPWSMSAWFHLVNKVKGMESMAGPGANLTNFGHLLTGAPQSKMQQLVASGKLDSSTLAALIRYPSMDNIKVQDLWAGLGEDEQARVFPVVRQKLGPHQLRSFLQRSKTNSSNFNWLDEDSGVAWSTLRVVAHRRMTGLSDNYANWTAGDLMKLGNLSVVLSPVQIYSLDPKIFTRPVLDNILSSKMTFGQLKAIYDQYMKLERGPGASLPPLLLSFLPPEVITGPGGASLMASDKGVRNLLIAANSFVPSQRRALYELVENQLWTPSVLSSVLLYYPNLLSFTPVSEFKTRLTDMRAAVSTVGDRKYEDIVNNIRKLPRRFLTTWLEQVFNATNKSGMWVTSVLLDLPSDAQFGGKPSYASIFSQGGPSRSLMPSLALTGLSCQLIDKIRVEDTLEVLAVYRSQLTTGEAAMPSNVRKCWARQVRKYLYLKAALFNVTVLHEVELLSLMSTADIRAIGGDVLLTWGGRILTGITHPQVMVESLIAVAQESSILYLNNGVWLSDMAAMAETLYLALQSRNETDLGILTKMRDMVPFLASKYLSSFKADDIQVFVRSVLRSNKYARTVCTTAQGRKNLRDFVIKGFSSPDNWTGGDMIDLGDLLIVLAAEDVKKINSTLMYAVGQLVQESMFTSTLPEIRGRGESLPYHEACAKWLSDESISSDPTEAQLMRAAWRSLGQLHLVGASLQAALLDPLRMPRNITLAPMLPRDFTVVPRRRRRQAVTANTMDLRILHDKVMSQVKNMFSANMLDESMQQAAIKVVTSTQEMLGNQSLRILGYDPAKVNMTQAQALALLANIKTSNNMTAEQSAQITQLASDTQVRNIQSLVRLLNLTPEQLELSQANFNSVMQLPTFAKIPVSSLANTTTSSSGPILLPTGTTTPPTPTMLSTTTRLPTNSQSPRPAINATSKSSVLLSSSQPASSSTTTTTPGFRPGDIADPDIFQYDDPSVSTSGGKWSAVTSAVMNFTSSTGTTRLPPVAAAAAGPLPEFGSLVLSCDSLRLAGRSAGVLDAAAVGRMNDSEVLDCLEVLGQLDFDPAQVAAISAQVWERLNRSRLVPTGLGSMRGNLMAMLGTLLPSIVAANPLLFDFNFKSNFDGLAVLGQQVLSNNVSSQLLGLYLAANQNGQQLTAVETAGLGQLLCALNATQWTNLVNSSTVAAVMDVLASLSCTLPDDVRGQIGRLVMAAVGQQTASWSASDLMGLGWLLSNLDAALLSKIPSTAFDGMCGTAASCLGSLSSLSAGQLNELSPHAASLLSRPLFNASYMEPPKRRAIRAAGGESPELLRVLDQLELNFKLLDEERSRAQIKSSGPGRPDISTFLLAFLYTSVSQI